MRGIRSEDALFAGCRLRREVAGDVSRGHAVAPQTREGDVREVLADAGSFAHRVGDGRGHRRRGLVVREVAEDALHEVGRGLPERPPRRERLGAVRRRLRYVPRTRRLERVFRRAPGARHFGVQKRAGTLPRLVESALIVGGVVDGHFARRGDGQLVMRIGHVEVGGGVAEIVAVRGEVPGRG